MPKFSQAMAYKTIYLTNLLLLNFIFFNVIFALKCPEGYENVSGGSKNLWIQNSHFYVSFLECDGKNVGDWCSGSSSILKKAADFVLRRKHNDVVVQGLCEVSKKSKLSKRGKLVCCMPINF